MSNRTSLIGLVGRRVRNDRGEALGRVADVLVEGTSGRAAYLSIRLEGSSEAPLVVPWSQVRLNPGHVTLDVRRSTLDGLVPVRWR